MPHVSIGFLELDLLVFFLILSCGMSRKVLLVKRTNIVGALLIVLFASVFLAGIALLAFSRGTTEGYLSSDDVLASKGGVIFYSASTTKELERKLRSYGLLNPYTNSVKPYLLKRFPRDFRRLPAKKRKRLFIAVMLPIALTVNEQFEQERQILLQIKQKMDAGEPLTPEEKSFLEKELKSYKAKNIKELLVKVDVVPVSLLIAQAAIESGWGKSRFTVLYNNIYGIHRRHRKPWQPIVRSFNNLYDATVAYVHNLDTSAAYRRFRKARARMGDNLDPYKLSEYLTMYSIKRNRYIRLIQSILTTNTLVQYDGYAIEQIMVSNYTPEENIQ